MAMIYFSRVLETISSNSAVDGMLFLRKSQSKEETRLEDEMMVEIYAALKSWGMKSM